MKKSIIRTLTVSALGVGALAGLSACGGVQGATYTAGTPVKVGIICLHDNSSTYDKNFLDALNTAVANLGASKVVLDQNCILTGVAEDEDCYTAAKDLVKKGCNLIFADSFGHQDYVLKAAKQWPTVQFCHATGTNAKTANLDNYHNAFASIYQGRYLAGLAAGIKLGYSHKQAAKLPDADAKVGYVGAYPYAEVKSGYTAWYLGVKAGVELCGVKDVSNVTMDVKFTNSWYDPSGEQAAAEALIKGGCKIISQHADSMGAPGACENNNPVIPNVTYNVITKADCPKSYLAYSRINWAPYYENAVNSMFAGKAFDGESNHNWTGTMATGSVEYDVNFDSITTDPTDLALLKTEFNTMAALIKANPEVVFATDRFTVKGQKVTTYKADTDGDFAGDTEVIESKVIGGETRYFFAESKYCAAPYFDLEIDGITILK